MSALSLILRFGFRIFRREWRRFVLPFLSLTITGVVLFLMLLLTGAGSLFLAEQSRELEGGDVVLESSTAFSGASLLAEAGLGRAETSTRWDFTGTLESESGTAPFSLVAVDAAFPLYGTLTLASGQFTAVAPGSLYLDAGGAERLGVAVGDNVRFGAATLTVTGIVESEPTSLFGGFRFFPRAFISLSDFASAGLDPALLRVEYKTAARVPDITDEEKGAVRALTETYPAVDVDIAGEGRQGLAFGLGAVTDFLTVAVIITAVLAAVNVYASILHLVTVERRSLAILLALGLTRGKLMATLFSAVTSVVMLASILSLLIGSQLFLLLREYVDTTYFITLPNPSLVWYGTLTLVTVFFIAIASFIPAVERTLAATPRQVLLGSGEDMARSRPVMIRNLITLTGSALVPLALLAASLLESLWYGLLTIGAIVAIYLLVAGAYVVLLGFLYRQRNRFPFLVRSLISQKRADGLFGVVAFTSLFVALASLCTLTLTQVSIKDFLTSDLSASIPSVYVIDVQPSQREALTSEYSDLTLFPNWGARIVSIDGRDIQALIEAGDPDTDPELRREFNLTARAELLASETVTAGQWSAGRQGEFSVDEEFADRAGIVLGSRVDFTIQGFPVSGVVTSLRGTDSRSGLPFFYFVLSPEDVAEFPGVYFGYGYFDAETRAALGRYVATTMPNVSVIETAEVGELVVRIISILMIIVFVITLPPLFIALLLVVTLIISSYAERRRHGARLRALGMPKRTVFWSYLAETVSVTLVASLLAYAVSLLVTTVVTEQFLAIDTTTLIALELMMGLLAIIVGVFVLAYYLFKTDILPLRELLSYE